VKLIVITDASAKLIEEVDDIHLEMDHCVVAAPA
jgi:hypothetical protein